MKRKLAHKDLLKLKNILEQMDIAGHWVTIDLEERTVVGESASLEEFGASPAGETLSEEEVVAELASRTDLSEPTAVRYLQSFEAYFETEQDKFILSRYNVKLLGMLAQLYAQGLSTTQILQELKQGDQLEALPRPALTAEGTSARTPVDFARDYFTSAEPMSPLDEEEERRWFGPKRKTLQWVLFLLVPLVLIVLYFGYQLGYLGGSDAAAPPPSPAPQPGPTPTLPGEGEEEDEDSAALPGNDAQEEPQLPGDDDPAAPTLSPEEITVDVLNGVGTRGAASQFAAQLREAGYQVRNVTDADTFDYQRSQIISRLEGNEARELQELLPQAELLQEAPGEGEAMITVILGADPEP